jgi:4-oxalocrotonate tautomerase
MPIVTIEWYEGRSAEQKREIAERLTELLVDVGKTQPEHVWIRFKDSSQSDWAMGGEIQSRPSSGGEPALGPPD